MTKVRRDPRPRHPAHVHVWREMHNPDARACIVCGAVRVQLSLPSPDGGCLHRTAQPCDRCRPSDEPPTVTAVGNLHDLLAYVGGGS